MVQIDNKVKYYSFHFITRVGSFILQARRLLQLIAVCKLEDYYSCSQLMLASKRLQFLRLEQDHLRADNYRDLQDAIVNQDGDPKNVGQKVILPTTFCGGPRYKTTRCHGLR